MLAQPFLYCVTVTFGFAKNNRTSLVQIYLQVKSLDFRHIFGFCRRMAGVVNREALSQAVD